ncbi:MAG: DUF6019 family protein [Tissierellaceae bacterium]|jgi:hypothetical protein
MGHIFANLVILPIYLILPVLIIYFIIKLAVKNGVKEAIIDLKNNNIM